KSHKEEAREDSCSPRADGSETIIATFSSPSVLACSDETIPFRAHLPRTDRGSTPQIFASATPCTCPYSPRIGHGRHGYVLRSRFQQPEPLHSYISESFRIRAFRDERLAIRVVVAASTTNVPKLNSRFSSGIE